MKANNRINYVLIFIGYFFLCSFIKAEALKIDILNEFEPALAQEVKGLFEACELGNINSILSYGSSMFSERPYDLISAATYKKEWKLNYFEVENLTKIKDGFYIVCKYNESLGKTVSESYSVMFWKKIGEKWKYMNFPFKLSGIVNWPKYPTIEY